MRMVDDSGSEEGPGSGSDLDSGPSDSDVDTNSDLGQGSEVSGDVGAGGLEAREETDEEDAEGAQAEGDDAETTGTTETTEAAGKKKTDTETGEGLGSTWDKTALAFFLAGVVMSVFYLVLALTGSGYLGMSPLTGLVPSVIVAAVGFLMLLASEAFGVLRGGSEEGERDRMS